MKLKYLSTLSVLFLVGVLLISSCKKKNDDEIQLEETITRVQETNIADTAFNKKIEINLTLAAPNPCYSFSRFTRELIGDTTSFELYIVSDINQNCAAVLGTVDTKIDAQFNKTGVHFFRFNSNTSEEILDTIFVKN